jgi:hypothetical protein
MDLVHKMVEEVATCLLEELRDLKKVTPNYSASEDGDFIWSNTTSKEHEACLGKMVTNVPPEAPFLALTTAVKVWTCPWHTRLRTWSSKGKRRI